MESTRNMKMLKARKNWKKRCSGVIILKGSRERVRSLQACVDAGSTSQYSCFRDSHLPVIRSDMDNNNSNEIWLRIKGQRLGLLILSVLCLSVDVFATTFPEMYQHLNKPPVDWPMIDQLYELTILLLVYYIMLIYICDLLNKDLMEKLVLRGSRVMAGYIFGFVSAIYSCICSTVQYANFHQHRDDRGRKSIVLYLFSLCLYDCRQYCYSGANESQLLLLLYMIRQAVSDEWIFLVIMIIIAIISATSAQILVTTGSLFHAVCGIYFSIMFVIFAGREFAFKARKERVKFKRRGMLCWFYHPDPDGRLFGTFTDVYGLISAFYQCIFCTVQSACSILRVDNPIRLCFLPIIFLICVATSTCKGSHRKKVILKEQMFLLINIGLEISAAIFEQLSSSSNPQYAFYGMLLAIGAVVISIWELTNKGKKERVKWMRRGTLWWFYHPPPHCTPFGTFPDIYGLIGGVAQCIFSTVQYICYLRHVDNPVKICFLPLIFLFCVAYSKRIGKSKTL